MSILSGALAWGRSLAEVRMSDQVRVFRRVLGPIGADGNPTVTDTDVYVGKCRLVLRSSVVRDVDAQSQLLGVQQPELHLPVAGSSGVRNADRFVLLESEGDPSLVGLSGVVAGMFPHTGSTARRLPVEVAS
ncbi:DUF6093 family protein [Agromyces cerinus]|uniref:DUF6093 family protein n=1 Tax=Agromyces cerinus TaxID=33878 RepID=UPI00117791D7|nr:DUF6093 family protein [Agromyces cerinus]